MFIRVKTAIVRTSSSGNRERFTLNIFSDNIKKMPVDKFGRRYYERNYVVTQKQGPVDESPSSGLTLAEMQSTFLRKDGSNSAIASINMAGNTLTNVSNPVDDHDVANKVYVDENAGVSKNGDMMLGDLDMNGYRLTGLSSRLPPTDNDAISWSRAVQLVRDSERDCVRRSGGIIEGNLFISSEANNDRVIGCTDLGADRTFSIPLEISTNKLWYVYRRGHPVVLDTDDGFMVKAENQLVCKLAATEITLYKDVRMNSNRITNLQEPQLAHEVANKLYVDRTARKILQGYVPALRSTSNSPTNDKFGFVVTASSHSNNFYLPSNAFNGVYSIGRGARGEWVTNGETRDFWIQIKCPDLVRVWKIGLRGRDSNTERIYHWRLEGSTDEQTFTSLFEPSNPSYIGNELEFYLIDTNDRYNIFRLFCLEAEPTNPGLSYMQLYVYSE